MVEGVFEADQFSQEGVVARVGVGLGLEEQPVESALRFVDGWPGVEKSGAAKAGGCDLDEAGFNGLDVGTSVGESLADERLARECGQQFESIVSRVHWVQKSATACRNKAGSMDGNLMSSLWIISK